ncbi:MAG: saccharopine dehydrogenase NADP-binding domain-containing protein [Alphaproteobacteria bacterium]|nr:saccharopine dehydrogenase NADP-binding domain-containing protein [Alphaproteobacteria bacterium]
MSMSPQSRHPAGPPVAVFGAAGHTGRFVVAELRRRGIAPIAIARDAAALAAHFPGDEIPCRRASLDDAASLDRALAGAGAVVNCAGPFLDTAGAVAAAALRARAHYLDVTAEQASAQATLDSCDAAARDAGVVVLPAMGFYGGFADLLVTAALGDWDAADAIEIMIGLDSWHPTRGTRLTGARNTAPRLVVAGGQLAPLPLPPAETQWAFGEPLGTQAMVELPFSEIVLIARHVKTVELHTYLNSLALEDIRDPSTPPPQPADATGRSPQRFAVDAVVTRGAERRRIVARGRDIYAFTAPLVCEVAGRLLDGRFGSVGAQAPGAILDARAVLEALAPDHLSFEIKTA